MSDDLQFDKAETAGTGGPSCQSCKLPLAGRYFQAGDLMVCEQCSEGIRAYLAGTGNSGGRYAKALLLGVGAAVIGAIAYGLWIGFTGSEFALVTIAMGWFIGKSVRKGSGGIGGVGFGLTAVLLTYAAISMSFMLSFVIELMRHAPEAGLVESGVPAESIGTLSMLFSMFSLSLQLPVMMAKESIISGVITGFGLWQAWVMNRRINVEITGPHMLGSAPPQAPAGV